MEKKIRVGVVFGGKSVEHEISNISAKKTIEALDKARFEMLPIGINKQGKWMWIDPQKLKTFFSKTGLLTLQDEDPIFTAPVKFEELKSSVDIVFPCLHGALGEDGAVQGLLKCLDIPFVGCDVLASAVCMDKDSAKKILRSEGIHVVQDIVLYAPHELDTENVIEKLGLPVFIKPSNGGSSIGTNKAENSEDIKKYVAEAFKFDHKVLIEKFIHAKEVPVAILGNQDLFVSLPGRIIPQQSFHTYETKYMDPKGFIMEIPLEAPSKILKDIQEIALKAYKALACQGLARVDIFLTDDMTIYVNEFNTMPGFTPRSSYPLVMEGSGISRQEVVSRLIELGLQKYYQDKQLEHSFEFRSQEEPLCCKQA